MAETGAFSIWWSQLPDLMRKGDKNRARVRFDAIQRRGEGELLNRALVAYIADQKANPWRQFQYASTWLGRWEEFIPAEAPAPELPASMHLCRVCAPAHEWRHSGPCELFCLGERYVTCPQERESMRRAIKAGIRSEKLYSLFGDE